MGSAIEGAVKSYIDEVQKGVFPTEKNSFIVDEAVVKELEKTNFDI
jgi:3-methyl-2-oxobutanoate hydroxymethyltransferase